METLWKITPVWLRVAVGVALIVAGFAACASNARPMSDEQKRRAERDPVWRQFAERRRSRGLVGGIALVFIGCGVVLVSERSRAERNGYTTLD